MEVWTCWKMVKFPKISIKMKHCKTFNEGQTASHVKEIIQTLPYPLPQPDKILLSLWNKYFQAFTFKVLQECSSWASRNDAAQMFFLTPNWKILAEKFVKWERFLALLREHIIFNVEWVEFHKMSQVLWTKLYCKMSELSRRFLLAFRLSARKFK